jgi:hypothetical protein
MSMRGDDDTPDDKPSEGQWVTGEKNPAAVALGRLGGRKGGPARAEKLSALRRSEIARLAAQKRWHSERDEQKEG